MRSYRVHQNDNSLRDRSKENQKLHVNTYYKLYDLDIGVLEVLNVPAKEISKTHQKQV